MTAKRTAVLLAVATATATAVGCSTPPPPLPIDAQMTACGAEVVDGAHHTWRATVPDESFWCVHDAIPRGAIVETDINLGEGNTILYVAKP